MSFTLIPMQSRVSIFEYHRPDRWLRTNTEFVILASAVETDPFLVIGVGPKSSGNELVAPDDLVAVHVIVGTRIGNEEPSQANAYILNRQLPHDLNLPDLFRTAQFFPADGVAELTIADGECSLTVSGRHAHLRDEQDRIIEVREGGMRSRVHIDGRVDDIRAALTWRFTARQLPWSSDRLS